MVELPWTIRRCLKWKLSTITPIVVRKTVVNSGFRVIKEPKDWIGTWGKHMKSPLFTAILEHQKVRDILPFHFTRRRVHTFFLLSLRSIIFLVHFKSEERTVCGETCKRWLPSLEMTSVYLTVLLGCVQFINLGLF